MLDEFELKLVFGIKCKIVTTQKIAVNVLFGIIAIAGLTKMTKTRLLISNSCHITYNEKPCNLDARDQKCDSTVVEERW